MRNPLRSGILWLVRDASGGLIDLEPNARELEHLQAQAARLHHENLWHAGVLLMAVGLFVAVPRIGRRHRRDAVQHLLLASTILLALGVWAPLLTITLHVDLPVVGRMMADSTTKGLWDTVALFLQGENPMLGVVILIFCIVVPLVKGVWLQKLILAPRLSGPSAAWLSKVGKFSMADVFVASTTVSVFAFNTTVASDAFAGVGFYFFTGYCLSSLLSSVMLERQAQY